jgi:DNA-binding CsgD family transcriptional regulator
MPTSITSPTSITGNRTTPRCVELAAVFQDQLLEQPTTGASTALRRRQLALITLAKAACRECPLITDCLYRAVVECDVAGYVAGTTPPQRALIRRRLDITVEPENFDTLARVTRRNRQVNHSEVVCLRTANPHESLDQLAQRLGCSLSTVKRHLRSERREPTARTTKPKPSVTDVLAAAATVTSSSTLSRRPQAA